MQSRTKLLHLSPKISNLLTRNLKVFQRISTRWQTCGTKRHADRIESLDASTQTAKRCSLRAALCGIILSAILKRNPFLATYVYKHSLKKETFSATSKSYTTNPTTRTYSSITQSIPQEVSLTSKTITSTQYNVTKP